MTSRVCNPACLEDVPQFQGVGCNILSSTRSAIIQKLIFTQCGLEWTDITDVNEWTDNINNNLVGVSPEGSGSKPFPTYSEPITIGCRPEINTKKEHTINFSTPLVDAENGTDFDDWATIEGNTLVYNISYLDCDGYIYSKQGMVADDELGFAFSGQYGYVMEGEGKATWQANITFEYELEPKGYLLPDDVLAILGTPIIT